MISLPVLALLGASILVPILLAVGILQFLDWRQKKSRGRVPVSEKLLRPAGESLRQKVEVLNDKLNEMVFLIFFIPTVVFITALAFPFHPSKASHLAIHYWIALGLSIATLCFLFRKLRRIRKELRNYTLGFHGERAVGEEINQLMLKGCRVFHDVPMDPYGNIDHVIVAPSGVYAVETKTRRKKESESGQKSHEVIFDGTTLRFPNYQDSHGLDQAQRNAAYLSAMLAKSVGEPVFVVPILTLPGWFVKCRAKDEGKVKVVNPKGIQYIVLNEHGRNGRALPQSLIERIAHQLDQKCRDVEL